MVGDMIQSVFAIILARGPLDVAEGAHAKNLYEHSKPARARIFTLGRQTQMPIEHLTSCCCNARE